MASPLSITLGLLTFVTIGILFGAIFQLAFISRIEHSTGISSWTNDPEADILRLEHVKPEVVSWKPRIVILHNFLSMEECDYLRVIALPRLKVSTVVDVKTGKAIEKRISVYSQVPIENGEHIQVLRYDKTQYYRPHCDFFSDKFSIKHGGQRVATMLMYLSDGVIGGETHFPLAGSNNCSCGGKPVKGICVIPKKGDAVLFWSMGLDGESDVRSVHGGCEVLSGEKWSATKWMRQRAFPY